jgi:hypothetical protein
MSEDVQFCGRCGSLRVRESRLIPFGDPIREVGVFGWECLDCKHSGKDFFIVSKEEHQKIVKNLFGKKK